ncbi:MAG: CoA transferase [Chloroflexi bacterium]|nr:CoA transferase [Chloroflexota bacterium]
MAEQLSSEGWTGPLNGLRVLDFGQAAVGPIAAEYLGWLGADAIKVESPRGDTVRGTKPRLRGTGHTFLGNNLGKRGVMLDLKDPADHAQALRLIEHADVLVENFRSPEVMRRLGLGYELLREHNPRLIYLQSSAYGPRGPMHGMTSNEWFSQAAAGLTSVTGEAGGRQQFSRGTATLDWSGAFTNLQALLVALYARERSGLGTFIQTSQLQSTIVGATSRIAEYFASGRAPGPMGSARPNLVPDQAFPCSDGYVAVSVPHDGFWRKLCDALGLAKLGEDPRFATNAARVERRAELLPILEACFRERGAEEWERLLHAADVPAAAYQRGPTLSASLLEHPQAIAEDLVTVLDTPYGGMASAKPHWRFGETEARITRAAPRHGEHTAEVFAQLEELDAAEATNGASTGAAAGGREHSRLPLEGLRVVDVSQGIPGALCAMQLGDLGADVVKLEPPSGDWLRAIGPFVEPPNGGAAESGLFLQFQRNKRGIATDLKTEAGAAILARLLDDADVLVEGYRPGVMERLGLGYEALRERHPRLVYCSISGHGSSGPLAGAPASEIDIQAIVGSNRHLGRPEDPPLRFGYDFAQHAAGMAGFQAILTALLWRDRHGAGQHVETSMLAALTAIHQWTFTAERSQDSLEGRAFTGLTDPPDHGFETADGPALITLRGDEGGWNAFLIAIDRPEVLLDERFSGPRGMMDNLAYLPPEINETLREWRFEDLRRIVQDELGGTIVPMHTLESLLKSEQVAALEMVRRLEGHATLGDLDTVAPPWTFEEPWTALRRPPPVLGQHTAEVLAELGYSASDIERLAEAGAVVVWQDVGGGDSR